MREINLTKQKNLFVLLDILVVVFLLWLPYYLFGGRLFLGGDDTRLMYAYPGKILQSLSMYSWVTISSTPSYLPNHHFIPFLAVFSLLDWVIKSKIVVFYFAFSLPFILGYIYFRKFILTLYKNEYLISFIAALIYIFSPITIVSQMFNFLSPMWLVALFPILGYLYISFVKSGRSIYIIELVLWSVFLSIAFFAIPWILGLLLPLVCGYMSVLIFRKHSVKQLFLRSVVYLSAVLSSQLFWLIPFIASLTYKIENDLGGKLVSSGLTDSFSPTVRATATGNIIYPLLTLYHRTIALNYEWQLKNIFISYYDAVLPFSLIYIVVVFLGLVSAKRVIKNNKAGIFLFFTVSFLASLFFFTVNIGPLKSLFLLFKYIPGFTIFRNFTDKFALSYIFIYSGFLAMCLYTIKKTTKIFTVLIISVLVVITINFLPVKGVVVAPLWKTQNIYTTVTLPREYLEFTSDVRAKLPTTANVISFPQNIASYSVITEKNGVNAYIGTSPFKFFSGINDVSGNMSYSEAISGQIQDAIMERDYNNLLTTLQSMNVGYLMTTGNVPAEVLNSFLFDAGYLKFQDMHLIDAISEREILRSSGGNFILYKLRNTPSILRSSADIRFKKISPVKYEIQIKDLKKSEKILFYESYHPGWKLFLTPDGSRRSAMSALQDLIYAFKAPLSEQTHRALKPYGNIWELDSGSITTSSENSLYSRNPEGSVNVILTLYFLPQLYFYIGVIMTVIALSAGLIIAVKLRKV